MARLAGKISLVTGAASGLGFAIAAAFITEGASVILTDIDETKGAAAAAVLGTNATFLLLDVGDQESWANVREQVMARHGGLDILVNNAGISSNGTIEQISIKSWRDAHRVNSDGVMLGCQTAIGLMRPRVAGGAIINIGSAAGVKASPFAVCYGATKAGVILLTRAVALHCAQKGLAIRCNVINPGIIDTPIHDQVYEQMGGKQAALEIYQKLTPTGKIGEASDVAHAAVYLASDEARFVTGASLEVDGGFTAA